MTTEQTTDDLVSVTVSGTADGVMRFLDRFAEWGGRHVVVDTVLATDCEEKPETAEGREEP